MTIMTFSNAEIKLIKGHLISLLKKFFLSNIYRILVVVNYTVSTKIKEE